MLEWIWENVSDIEAARSIIAAICSAIAALTLFLWNKWIKHVKRKQIKYFKLDKQTKQSMRYYVSTRGMNIDPCDQENIGDDSEVELIPFFMKAFKNSKSQYYIILADSGMGKTTFLLKLFYKYRRRKFRKYKIILVPLSMHQALAGIKKIKNKQKTILLLDGFDEDPLAMEDYISRLKEICNETEMFYKIVMTCRTQFFPDSENEPRNTGRMKFGVGKKNVEFEKYYILPFNESEIKSYLAKKYNRFLEKEKFNRSLELVLRCPQLVIRPMLLSYIDDLLEDSEKEYNKVYEIYDQLVGKWIERESVSNSLLYEFSEKVAEYMYSNKTVYIEGMEIENLCEKYDIELRSIEAKSRSLLNRNAIGSYKFAHKSILEYFLFRKAYDELEFRKVIIANGLSGYEMLKSFLKEKSLEFLQSILRDGQTELKAGVFQYLILSESDFSRKKITDCEFMGCIFEKANFIYTEFCNVDFKASNLENANFTGADLRKMTFHDTNLKKCDFRNATFRNTDLEGVNLESVKLEGAKLIGANLKGANLRRASLSWANLYRADLTGADLDEAVLIETNFREASLQGVNLRKAYLCYSKSLFEYDRWFLELEDDLERSLKGADLTGADLSGVNLRGVNLQSARLVLADLSKAIFANSNLAQANLSGAKLMGADLTGADLMETILDSSVWNREDVQAAWPQIMNNDFVSVWINEGEGLCEVPKYKVMRYLLKME